MSAPVPTPSMPAARPTQKDVARKAGVTQATVSLALRNHPDVSGETCARIQEIARKLGYSPDPYLAGLSAYRKTRRPVKFQASLAWLSNYPDGETWRNFPAFRGYFDGATTRARELGYRFEEFRLVGRGMTAGRMGQILAARNIGGILVAPQPRAGMKLDFPFERFSAVTFGYTLTDPQLHLTALHIYRSMETAFRRLIALGYRRPGLAIASESDRRADRNWSAAFWSEQRELPERNRLPLLLGQPLDRATFLAWYRRHEPDVVLAIWPEVCDWLREAGIAVPAKAGFALLTVPDGGAVYSGIWENPNLIGAKAVEFLIDLMHRSERGVPEVPLSMLVAGTWVDGRTVRSMPP
ncbi:MAG TPA: LacI family DNA-binding transcriptional regulator [Opitutaceae bacterium]|nr:LacI family DNA-binding transcriptional regulator [Opitutaceae bacterium]